MSIKYEKRDLFDLPHGFCFAHCVSTDCALGAGIAKEINKRYNMSNRLMNRYSFAVGDVEKVDNVFNLFTKELCYHKPTYDSLQMALEELRNQIVDDEIKKLGMPKIGCGLDGLNWKIVKAIIEETFKSVDCEIVICFLDDDKDFVEEEIKDNIKTTVASPSNEDWRKGISISQWNGGLRI